jgi:hypothetical protein
VKVKDSESLDLILNHFQEPIFPRKIMTRDLGYQVEAFKHYVILKVQDMKIAE